MNWFKDHGKWLEPGGEPAAGMLIFFNRHNRNGVGNPDHVGIVKEVKDGIIYTVEGNSSNMVRERNYGLNERTILGYGVMSGAKTN